MDNGGPMMAGALGIYYLRHDGGTLTWRIRYIYHIFRIIFHT
jgi:hypothetical protein